MQEDIDNQEGYDWNNGHPDHEGEMVVSQLHRIVEMANMLLDIVGENDEFPAWVQYLLGRSYNDMSEVFGYIESKSHNDLHYDEDGMMLDIDDEPLDETKKKGLWHYIRLRRKKINLV